ncbi:MULTISPECIES: glycoside hydrolase family 53 protein [Dysgonomonas]|uniref:glycoside hydrolase family 53 protein n=1 Tax=Dysgonomonas TaxID=156973 RepID=UPI00092B1CFD|nr:MULTISPECIES: glycosyl hydrolase 53 family protein [Dysgonomonas]MBN9303346.1 glycosyl hydrolase 53 family protein [Dysgonomonas mossii]OJX56542.1 MAG: arabinogalactan endo-1,4-beta-galactosidase [Dysgonomonas sp. 37-18]
MKLKNIILTIVIGSLGFAACVNEDKPTFPEKPIYDMTGFAKGADVSWLTEMEKVGNKFYNSLGHETECMTLLRDLGMNSIRLRVWVNPVDGWCNKSDVLVKAWRAKLLGMRVMIDFHYSDTWADPSKQNIPAAWEEFSFEELKTAVSDHTKEVLNALKEKDITPEWVQVGNEISNGFLWEMGQADKNPVQYAGLFAAGYEAAKSVFPETIVIVHLDSGSDNNLYNWNLDILKNNGAKWDMIGMSLYPYWARVNGQETSSEKVITDCIENIKKVSTKYDCDVMIVETGMECADDDGKLVSATVLDEGKTMLSRIIKECKENTNGRCKGVFYWEPQCKPSKYRLGAFTEDGYPTVIMDAFK